MSWDRVRRAAAERPGVVVAVVMGVYAALSLPLEGTAAGATPVVVLPVTVVAWLAGTRAGFLAGAVGWPIDAASLYLHRGDIAPLLSPPSLIGWATLALLVLGLGRLSDLSSRLELELAERQRVERQLLERDASLHHLVDRLPAILWTSDRDLRFTLGVGGGLEAIGILPNELVGEHAPTFLGVTAPGRPMYDAMQAALRGVVSTLPFEFAGRTYDVRVGPLLSGEAGIVGTVGIALDVTDRAEAERALITALEQERRSTERLREVDEIKNAFLEAVSHELRTPLTAVTGFAQTLRANVHRLEPDRVAHLLGRIEDNADRLGQLLNDLLDLDRLTRGIVAPKLREVALDDLVERVVADHDHAEGRLAVDVERVVIRADGPKVERIVENLVANALKYTPSDVTVTVAVRTRGDVAELRVEQERVGIPDRYHDVIFEPFQRGPQVVSHSPGTGIGLSLVRRFAELHGGTATVEPRRDGGAAFVVRLPVDGPDPAAGHPRHEAPERVDA